MRTVDRKGKILADIEQGVDGVGVGSPDISVIVPIYNVERFLPAFLESLSNQRLDGIEFLLVDDGSRDSSSQLAAAHMAEDGRFRLISKENGGYGSAVNEGLAQARGRYVAIAEPDDVMDSSMYESLWAVASRTDCDVVKQNYYELSESRGEVLREPVAGLPLEEPFDPAEHPEVLTITPSIWSALYKREMLENAGVRLLRTPGASFQDTSFVLRAFMSAASMACSSEAHYRYRVDNPDASCVSGDKAFCVCEELKATERFLDGLPRAKREAFASALLARKVIVYRWNATRVAYPYRYAFLLAAREDILRSSEAVGLDPSMLPEATAAWADSLVRSVDEAFAPELERERVARERERAARDALREQVAALKASRSWKVGRAVTSAPRLLKRTLGGRGRG